MASVFTRILAGELPGRILVEDDRCAALLTIAPLSPGHTLVVPRAEIDHWTDLPPDLAAHLMVVAQRVGVALRTVFPERRRVGLLIAGLEVPHSHLHVFTLDAESEIRLDQVDHSPDPLLLDDIAGRLRDALAAAS
jgi:diadenosine tetraphosphate (Ap4A) HIT family hydrolase